MKITLCGSAQFESKFHEWNEKLTLAGHLVYGLGAYPSHHGNNKNWYTHEQKRQLDQVHLMKILASDSIVVITDETGYIGDLAKAEINWALLNSKEIHWTNDEGIEDILGEPYLVP